jgi:hypothetical protein
VNAAIVNLPKACAVTQWRERIVTAAASGTPVNLTTISISAITSVDGTDIATATSTAHGLLAGDFITISGATTTQYNGRFEILSVPTANTFTYRVPKGILLAASGTLVGKADLYYRTAHFRGLKAARTANTGIVYLGLSSTNDSQPLSIATSAVLTLEAPTGARHNLADLWLDVATNADGVVIWWC